MWPLESADRSRVGVVVASKTFRNEWLRSADQLTSGNERQCSRQDPQQLSTSPSEVYADGKQLIKEGRHVGLDFYDLLIGGVYMLGILSLPKRGFGCNGDFYEQSALSHLLFTSRA
jgi:hypothetical protein